MSTLYPLQKLLIVPYLQISNNNEKVKHKYILSVLI